MQIAIVTGASSGMGRDFAVALEKEYQLDELWVLARRENRLQELAATLSTPVRTIALDLSKEESVEELRLLLEKVKPEVKVLVNAAGYGVFGEFATSDRASQTGIVDLNDRALVDVTYSVLPYMLPGSVIINMGSNSSHQPVPYIAVYGASKAFVLSFSRALAVELKKRDIFVMCVCPGWIKTEFFDRAVHDNTIVYYDRYYTSQQVVDKAMKDLRKRRKLSILGFPVRMQVRLIKFLPVDLVMKIWCKQQKKD